MAFVYFTEGIEEGNELVADFENAAKELTINMKNLQEREIEKTRISVAGIIASTNSVKNIMFLLNGLAIALSVAIAFMLTRSITGGDFDREIDVYQKDEIENLAAAFRDMKATIGAVLQETNTLIQAVEGNDRKTGGPGRNASAYKRILYGRTTSCIARDMAEGGMQSEWRNRLVQIFVGCSV